MVGLPVEMMVLMLMVFMVVLVVVDMVVLLYIYWYSWLQYRAVVHDSPGGVSESFFFVNLNWLKTLSSSL